MRNTFAAALARKVTALTLVCALMFVTLGCYTQRVDVGAGAPSGAQRVEHRQWFALWGLVPITQIEPEATIGDAQNYSIVSEFTPLDVIIGIFTGIVTVYPKTIIVEQ